MPATDRLTAAMQAYLEFRQLGGETAAFLARHAHLHDLLEPLCGAGNDLDDEAQTQRILGGYRLEHELGRGGMGVVFAATRLRDSQAVAVKVLPKPLSLLGSAVARFHREAKLAASLDHAGLVKVLEIAEADGTHLIAMERIDGVPLDRVLLALSDRDVRTLTGRDLHAAIGDRRSIAEPPPWAQRGYAEAVLGLVAQVADALAHVHSAGISHRDVKPSNLIVRHDGTVVLTDFGLANAEGLPSVTATGDFAGTPFYVSPEQAMAKRVTVDHRTDVFSLGVVLYELLTLQRPFPGETSREVLAKIITKEPVDPVKLNADLAPDLATITLKALEKDPDRRYPSCAAMASDLRAFRDYRKIAARRATPIERVRRFCRREPLKAALASVLVLSSLGIAGLGGYLLATRTEVAAGKQKLASDRIDQVLADALMAYGGADGAAQRALEQALQEFPAHPELVSAMAMLRNQRQGPAAALALLDAHAPQSTERLVLRLRAALLKPLGRTAEAEAIEQSLGAPQLAFEYCLLALQVFAPAVATGAPPDGSQALDYAERAVATAPVARPLFHLVLAGAAQRANNRAAIERAAEALPRLWPGSAAAWYWSGYALERIDPDRAMAAYAQAQALAPGHAGAHYRHGLCLQRAGEHDEAQAAFERAVQADPQLWGARIMRSYELARRNDTTTLERETDEWLAAATDSTRGLLSCANFLLTAPVPEHLRARALPIARRAVEVSESGADELLLLARALHQSGDRSAALETAYQARRAIEANPAVMVKETQRELHAEIAKWEAEARGGG